MLQDQFFDLCSIILSKYVLLTVMEVKSEITQSGNREETHHYSALISLRNKS